MRGRRVEGPLFSGESVRWEDGDERGGGEREGLLPAFSMGSSSRVDCNFIEPTLATFSSIG